MGPADKKCSPGHERIALDKARDYKDLVIVQEKLDGSNCGVAKINGTIVALSRAGYDATTSPYEQHHKFANWVSANTMRFYEMLKEGERACGEWMIQAHGTKYKLPHEPFVIFDIMEGMERMPFLEFEKRTAKLDFITPRIIHVGQPMSLKRVIKSIQVSGHGATEDVEGAVWRVERENKVDFIIKYVRPEKIDGKYLPSQTGQPPVWNE